MLLIDYTLLAFPIFSSGPVCDDPPLSTVVAVSHVRIHVQEEYLTYTCVNDDIGGLTSTVQTTTVCNSNTNYDWNLKDNCTVGKYSIPHLCKSVTLNASYNTNSLYLLYASIHK